MNLLLKNRVLGASCVLLQCGYIYIYTDTHIFGGRIQMDTKFV